jgi:ribosome-associated heat shock protein Hsp15
MNEPTERADKFLWGVRLYKSRTMATEACEKKQVIVNDITIKASRQLREGEIFKIKHPPVYRIYKIKQILHNRVGAALVPEYLEEITPLEDLETLELIRKSVFLKRDRGTGRPTKKDRRDLKDYFEGEE